MNKKYVFRINLCKKFLLHLNKFRTNSIICQEELVITVMINTLLNICNNIEQSNKFSSLKEKEFFLDYYSKLAYEILFCAPERIIQYKLPEVMMKLSVLPFY